MAGWGASQDLLRTRKGAHAGRVTFVELFFDLVFVFAITQLSHGLLAHLSPLGAVQTLLMFVAVWWVWVNTSWCTNWLDPEKTPVRAMLMGLMLAGLCLSTSIPKAFEDKGLGFAAGLVAMQVGRSLFMLWALRTHDKGNHRNFQRITIWLLVAGGFWIAGALVSPDLRLGLWAAAVLIESSGPASGYRVPGLGRSVTADWQVDGHHMAERAGLFIIIALGESVLITGATFADLTLTTETALAFGAAFVGSAAMWWIYFDVTAEKASERIAGAADPGRIARLAYTYLHIPLVAGIVVCAVADELVLSHPSRAVSLSNALIFIGGPALYVLGNTLFKKVTCGWTPKSHVLGLVLLAACCGLVPLVTSLGLTLATTGTLLLVAIIETIGLRRAKV